MDVCFGTLLCCAHTCLLLMENSEEYMLQPLPHMARMAALVLGGTF